jgi:hypothetical protein
MRFTRGDENKNSNCYAFVYDLLDIDLEVLSNFEAKKAEGDNSATPIPDERPF